MFGTVASRGLEARIFIHTCMRLPMEHHNKREKFLELLAEFGVVREACRGAGVSRTHMYRLRESDDEFRGRWDEALEESIEAVEAEARRRAMEKSDLLIIFWLKA